MSDLSPLALPAVQDYAERSDVHEEKLDRLARRAVGAITSRGTTLRVFALRPILRHVHRHAPALQDLSDADLQARADALRPALRRALMRDTLPAAPVGEAFAVIREAAFRTLGMRHYDVQLLGAFAMLRGQIAEMRTGEGKTLCATLAAATAGLGGMQTHVITVNDYLAERDAEEMGPLYRFLGLSVGVILEGQQEDERRRIYDADIVHGSNKEIAFDYLRDRGILRTRPGNLRSKVDRIGGRPRRDGLRMRGLHFALIDEADSVLIDEARTPLVISGAVARDAIRDIALHEQAMDAARNLREGVEYKVHANERRIELLDPGLDRLDRAGERAGGAFDVAVIREQMVTQALTALHLFHRDEAYIVRDDKVQIVDENTGRVQEDRSWSDGLHQMVELKEGVELTDPRETISRITYQRYLRRYGRLGGMTGTARDAAWELHSVYGLKVVKIPTNKRDIRRFASDRVLATEAAKWKRIAKRTEALHAKGIPVLIGTRSVAASEAAAAALEQAGLTAQILNARQDANEAAIVARAGQEGAITVATNMAGRGTDIKLGDGVGALGGLHVILTERHDSRRVDRQLEGRCGRQGDPGRVERFLSLEDELMRGKGAKWHRRAARVTRLLGPWVAGRFIRMRQRQIERLHGRMRRDLLDADRQLGSLLAVSGQME